MEKINKRLGEVLKNSLEIDKDKFIKTINSICDTGYPKDLCGLSIKDYIEGMHKPLDVLNLILTSEWKEIGTDKRNRVLNLDIHFDPLSIRQYCTKIKPNAFTQFVDIDDLHPNTQLRRTSLLDDSGNYLTVNSEDVCPKTVRSNKLILTTFSCKGKEVLHTLVIKKYRFISEYIIANNINIEVFKNNPYTTVNGAKELGVKAIRIMV
jgi:hypothetical protein